MPCEVQNCTLLWWIFMWYYAHVFCHMLLGGPWQYDWYVVHNARLNQYTLWVNGKKQILLPLIESPDEVSCTE